MDKIYYFIFSLYLGNKTKKTNVETSLIKNVFYVEYYKKWVKNMYKVYYLIISLYLVTIIKKTNVKTSMIIKVFHFEYHI